SASAPLYSSSSQGGVLVNGVVTTWVNFTLTFTAGWIAGTVTANGAAVASVGITVLSGGTSIVATSTDSQGKYNVSVADGTYTVNATSPAYYAQSKTGVGVTGGATTTVDFQLVALPTNGGGLSSLQLAGIGLAVVLIAAGILAIFLLRRKRKREEQEAKINLPPR